MVFHSKIDVDVNACRHEVQPDVISPSVILVVHVKWLVCRPNVIRKIGLKLATNCQETNNNIA